MDSGSLDPTEMEDVILGLAVVEKNKGFGDLGLNEKEGVKVEERKWEVLLGWKRKVLGVLMAEERAKRRVMAVDDVKDAIDGFCKLEIQKFEEEIGVYVVVAL